MRTAAGGTAPLHAAVHQLDQHDARLRAASARAAGGRRRARAGDADRHDLRQRINSLQRSRISNRGQITSIAPGQGPQTGQWVITTQETTTGQGDYRGLPAQAHIYIARLTHTIHGWAVSTWAPQG